MGCVPFQRWLQQTEGAADLPPSPGLQLSGDLGEQDAAAVARWLGELPEAAAVPVLDFSEADLPTGAGMAAMTAVLVRALDGGQALHLEGPPQLLLHNLYRVGRYPHILLSVANERHDEAYG